MGRPEAVTLLFSIIFQFSASQHFHEHVHQGASELPDEYFGHDEDGMRAYGLIRIPASKPQRTEGSFEAFSCSSWQKTCSKEYAGRYDIAIAEYEVLMQTCGDGPWMTLASLGKGETASVILRRTPCGSLVAAKFPKTELAAAHGLADCAIMKRLSALNDREDCQDCFPRYYHYSNISGICYSEFVSGVPMNRLMSSLNPSHVQEALRLVKPALHQLVDIVALMRANGVIHKDLLFKNMMARKLSSNHNPPIRVTVMDFCWSSSDHDPEAFSNTNNRLGHFTRPGDWQVNGYDDMYAVGCNFADTFYPGATGGRYRTTCLPNQDSPRTDPSKLEHVLWHMTRTNRTDRIADAVVLHAMIEKVVTI